MQAPRSVLVGLVLCAGCQGGGPPPDAVVFDVCAPVAIVFADEATAERVASVDDAIAMWRDRGVVGLTRAEPDAGAPADADAIPLSFEEAADTFHGFYDPEDGRIYVNEALDDRAQRAITIAHELGHAFGLGHVEMTEVVSVMNPGNLTIAPTDADEAALRALWGRCETAWTPPTGNGRPGR